MPPEIELPEASLFVLPIMVESPMSFIVRDDLLPVLDFSKYSSLVNCDSDP
jgi:hypothetical protein